MTEDKCRLFSKKYGYMTFINLCAGGEIEKCARFSDTLLFFHDTSLFSPTRCFFYRHVALFPDTSPFFPTGLKFQELKATCWSVENFPDPSGQNSDVLGQNSDVSGQKPTCQDKRRRVRKKSDASLFFPDALIRRKIISAQLLLVLDQIPFRPRGVKHNKTLCGTSNG